MWDSEGALYKNEAIGFTNSLGGLKFYVGKMEKEDCLNRSRVSLDLGWEASLN